MSFPVMSPDDSLFKAYAYPEISKSPVVAVAARNMCVCIIVSTHLLRHSVIG